MSLWNLYVGGLTEDVWHYHPRPPEDATIPARGIETFIYDDSVGSVVHQETTAGDLFSPQHLIEHPNLPVIYAAEFARPGRLISFMIHPNGHLERQSTTQTNGNLAICAAIHPNGTRAYVGHLGDGAIATIPLDRSGRIDEDAAFSTIRNGSGTKIHHLVVTPSGDALIATDFGRDEITCYSLDSAGEIRTSFKTKVRFPDDCSPRQIDLHPSGKYAYVVGIGDSHLYVLECTNFHPRRIVGKHSVTAPALMDSSSVAETSLHADGRRLFVGIRGADRIAVFHLSASGFVENKYEVSSFGKSPRSVKVDPSGKFLFVANWHSNQVRIFDGAGGGAVLTSKQAVEIPSPSSFAFSKRRLHN